MKGSIEGIFECKVYWYVGMYNIVFHLFFHLSVPMGITLGEYISTHFWDDLLIKFAKIIGLQLPHNMKMENSMAYE
jgi:hypothetical protein